MNYWFLVHIIGEIKIYLTPDHQFSQHQRDAIKFQNEENCKSYLEHYNSFLKFCVKEELYLHNEQY